MIGLITVAAGSLLMRWVHARGVVRQQIKWFTYVTVVLAIGVILKNLILEPMYSVWL